jgi:site-specific DNA-adenine methylase
MFWEKWPGKQVSLQQKWGANMVYRWVLNKGTGTGVYGYGTKNKFNFCLGQYTSNFQAEVYAI